MAGKLLPGFHREKSSGRAERFVDESTGEIISRRQYDKIRRERQLGEKISNEALAKFNKQVEHEKAQARPARGKKSALKLPKEERERIVRERDEAEAARKKREKEIAEQKKAANKIQRARQKKVKTPKKITGALLTPGAMGRTIRFGREPWDYSGNYEEYTDLYSQAKKSGKIFGYTVGVDGVDIRSGKDYQATIWPLRGFDKPLSESQFFNSVAEFIEEKSSYFLFTRFHMHLAFKKEYAEQKKLRFGDKRKHRKNGKLK